MNSKHNFHHEHKELLLSEIDSLIDQVSRFYSQRRRSKATVLQTLESDLCHSKSEFRTFERLRDIKLGLRDVVLSAAPDEAWPVPIAVHSRNSEERGGMERRFGNPRKLTDEQVKTIMARHKKGGPGSGVETMAVEFKCSTALIYQIVKKKAPAYKHLT